MMHPRNQPRRHGGHERPEHRQDRQVREAERDGERRFLTAPALGLSAEDLAPLRAVDSRPDVDDGALIAAGATLVPVLVDADGFRVSDAIAAARSSSASHSTC